MLPPFAVPESSSDHRRLPLMSSDTGRFPDSDEQSLQDLLDRFWAPAQTQGQWCNLEFEVDEDHPAYVPDSPLFAFLAARGPASPLVTIIAGEEDKPNQLGVQHRAGTKTRRTLVDAGIIAPDEAKLVQDHPRRGLVVEIPRGADTAAWSRWLLATMHELNRSPATGWVVWGRLGPD